MKKHLVLTLCIMFVCIISVSAQYNRVESLIPAPQKIELKKKSLVLNANVTERINKKLDLPTDEAYTLTISSKQIVLTAKTEQGLIWARQTLRQLTDKNGYVPQVYIEDYPAFDIRGFMNDTGRNFVEVDILKRHIDIMSQYKLNVFHWHLTDHPAWRVESKVYPQLNDAKFQRKGRDEGKFYTYDEIRDVIDYASKRGVMVVPEIDMPGHSQFFDATFGFSMASDKGMAILEKCLTEFFEEIPAELCPYFHIGSDEIHISNPKEFMAWAEGFVTKHGRKAIAWDPGLTASPTTIRQVWNTASASNIVATDKEGPFLDSFMGYLNYYNPMVFSDKMFLHNPCLTGKGSDKAKGGVLCLWNDVRVDDNMNMEIHNGMMSGLLPFSERFWHGGSVGHKGNTAVNPSPISPEGVALWEFQNKMVFHRDSIIDNARVHFVASSAIEWDITIPAKRGTPQNAMRTIKAWGGSVDLEELYLENNVKLSPTMDSWAITYIHSAKEQTITAWVGFEATARSNRISNGLGYQGEWENDGRLIVNGTDVAPAQKWKKPAGYRYQYHTWAQPPSEVPFDNEQFFWTRKPVTISLKKGRNMIEMYIPKVFSGQRWSFSFIPVEVDGDKFREVKGIGFVQNH